MAGRRSLTRKEIKAEADLLERAVTAAGGGQLPDGLRLWRPGGERNPDRDARAQFVWHRQLVAAHARAAREDSPDQAKADRAVAAALSGAPLTRLSRVHASGDAPRYLTVYPKSFVVLSHLYARDLTIARLQPAMATLFERPEFEPEVIRRVVGAIADENLLCAWIACHPGCGMPWEPELPPPAELPDWLRALHPVEVHQLLEMNLEVNFVRLAAMRQLVTPDPGPAGAVHWSPFFAKAGELLGESPRALMRDHSLEAVLAQMQLLAEDRRQQQREIDRKREGAD